MVIRIRVGMGFLDQPAMGGLDCREIRIAVELQRVERAHFVAAAAAVAGPCPFPLRRLAESPRVPFLFRVHGSPEDYNRHTASWWERYLTSVGIDAETLEVHALVWDPAATAFSIVEFTRLRRYLKKPVMAIGLLADRAAGNEQAHARRNADFALGWFISGRKSCP